MEQSLNLLLGNSVAGRAAQLCRGVRRALAARGHATLAEVALATGRRADIMAVDGQGRITIVEIKSGPIDYLSDGKWPQYEPFCDRFYFGVADDFPDGLIPQRCGLMVADAYDAVVRREAPLTPLAPARRRALLLQFAQAAAWRLHRLEDPGSP